MTDSQARGSLSWPRVSPALKPRLAVAEIVAQVRAIRYWIDLQIREGRTDAEIVALAPVAIAFINGDLTIAELENAVVEGRHHG